MNTQKEKSDAEKKHELVGHWSLYFLEELDRKLEGATSS